MFAFDVIRDILGSLQGLSKAQNESLKAAIDAEERRTKLAVDRAESLERENKTLKEEVASLREQVGFAGVSEAYEMRGRFLFKVGSDNELCPNCRTILSQRGYLYSCCKCDWSYTVPHASCATASSSDSAYYQQLGFDV